MAKQKRQPNYLEPQERRISRRQALGVLGGGGVLAVGLVAGRELLTDPTSVHRRRRNPAHSHRHHNATTTTSPPTTEAPPQPALWSDPETWGGAVPGAGDVAVVERPVILDIDTQVAGVRIRPAGQLVFDPNTSHTLRSTGNVVVEGTLQMRPSSPAIQQVLSFLGVNEGAFVGGHTEEPLDSDVGVWVVGAGMLDLMGSTKTAWTHLAAEAPAGATTITVEDATGWQAFDEVVVTPTEPATVDGHWTHHDRRIVTAVAGNQVTLDRPLDHPHPFVPVRADATHRAEVLNLGRNVRIEGAPDARTHIIVLHAHMAQEMGWFSMRHVGPRQGDEGVLGRYALHFHMCEDGVRGSTVDGAVVMDSGNHAFVVHTSHGVSLRNCVAHDNVEDAYWWDLAPDTQRDDVIITNDVLYENCVASYVRSGSSPHDTSGFLVGAGQGNTARGCVATGIDGDSLAAGSFRWDGHSSDGHIWVFEDNVSHNNRATGIYYWQNNVDRTIIDRFTVYYCDFGIVAGAYSNSVSYRDSAVYACTSKGLFIEATNQAAGTADSVTYEGIYVDQAGLTDFAVEISDPSLEGSGITPISGCHFRGGTTAQVGIDGGDLRQQYEFRNCTFEGNAFWIAEGVSASSDIRVVDRANGSMRLLPLGAGGRGRPEWNAAVTSV
jgi:hypothetical protein